MTNVTQGDLRSPWAGIAVGHSLHSVGRAVTGAIAVLRLKGTREGREQNRNREMEKKS